MSYRLAKFVLPFSPCGDIAAIREWRKLETHGGSGNRFLQIV